MRELKEFNVAIYGDETIKLCDLECPDCREKELKMAYVTDAERIDMRCLNCGYVAMYNAVNKKPKIIGILETTSIYK
jgi:uncharacterized Zn finger protein